METLAKKCACGGRPHEPIIGKEKSQKSAAYPGQLCKDYAKLAIAHFKKMAQAEFLEGRLVLLNRNIKYLKEKAMEYDKETLAVEKDTKEYQCSKAYRDGEEALRTRAAVQALANKKGKGEEAEPADTRSAEQRVKEAAAPMETEASRETEEDREGKGQKRKSEAEHSDPEPKRRPDTGPMEKGSVSVSVGGSSGSKEVTGPRNKGLASESQTGRAHLEEGWKGGSGKYGLMQEPKAKADVPAALVHVGGMRDPLKAVAKLPTVQILGKKLWERWTRFIESNPEALDVAETYGATGCNFNQFVVEAWEKALRTEWGVPPGEARLTEKGVYRTPVKEEILRGWVTKSGDPETEVCNWLKEGTPLGIEIPIKKTGVFPPMESQDSGPQSYIIADAVLERPETLKNYKSVEEDIEGAETV